MDYDKTEKVLFAIIVIASSIAFAFLCYGQYTHRVVTGG